YLGILGESIEGGAKLTKVTPDSPAAKAGLKEGDIVTAIDKKPIKNYEDLTKAIQARKPDDKLPLTIKRDKETLDIEGVLGTGEEPVHVGLGGEETKEGLKIIQIVPKGPADKVGLKPEDVITAIDKKPVKNPNQVQELLRGKKPGDKLVLSVQRGKETKDY